MQAGCAGLTAPTLRRRPERCTRGLGLLPRHHGPGVVSQFRRLAGQGQGVRRASLGSVFLVSELCLPSSVFSGF